MGVFPSSLSSDIICDKDLFPSLPCCDSTMSSSCESYIDQHGKYNTLTLSFNKKSKCNKKWYTALFSREKRKTSDINSTLMKQDSISKGESCKERIEHNQNIYHHTIQKNSNHLDRYQYDRHKSSAIACPLSTYLELSNRSSEVSRFQKRRYEEATWQMYHRICKARAKRGALQNYEKPGSIDVDKIDNEQGISPCENSLLDMEVFAFDY